MKRFALSILILAGLVACGDSLQSSIVQTYIEDPAAIARGRAIFTGTCAGYCHKTTNIASDAPYLFDSQWLHGGSDQDIFNTISNGVPGTRMIAFGTNFPEGEDDLWKIVDYLRSSRQK